MAYIGKEPIVGNFQKCDAITVVNGQAAYTLQVSSTNVVPESANHMLVSLNGILQAPVTSFTVSGATLTFASNLATGDVIDFVILLGNVLDLGTPSDGTVTNAKLAQDIISGETALASEPADTDEFLVSDAGVLKRIDYSLIKASNTPAFSAYQGSSQSIANNTNTKMTSISTEDFDTDSDFASDKFTPTASGKYLFIINAIYASGTNAEYAGIQLRKNGSNVEASYMVSQDYNRAILTSIQDANGSSDYFEVYALHQLGESANVQISEFSGYKLIGT